MTNLEFLRLWEQNLDVHIPPVFKKLKYLNIPILTSSEIPSQTRYTLKYLSVLDMSTIDENFNLPNLIYLESFDPCRHDISNISTKIKFLKIQQGNHNNSVFILNPQSLEYLSLMEEQR